MNFLCSTFTCVQMFTGMGFILGVTPNSYLASTQNNFVYCERSSIQYGCRNLSNASSIAVSGERPVNSGRLDW